MEKLQGFENLDQNKVEYSEKEFREQQADVLLQFLDTAEGMDFLHNKKFEEIFSSEENKRDFIDNLEIEEFIELLNTFNGMPKYFELIEDNSLKGEDARQIIKKLFCEEDAYLIKEGKNILIEEFGRSYEKYFSVLTAIALGKTTKNEIYNYTGININSIMYPYTGQPYLVDMV